MQGTLGGKWGRSRDEYFEAGAQVVWLVNRKTRTVAVYTSPEQCETLTENDVLTGGTVLPGFTLEVHQIVRRVTGVAFPNPEFAAVSVGRERAVSIVRD